MTIEDTLLSGVKIIHFNKKQDQRGIMDIALDEKECQKNGINFHCIQQRVYQAPFAHTFYGIHFQGNKAPQAKLIYCIAGKGIDYIVDLNKESSTYLKWISIEIGQEDDIHIYIPQGYGHAFLTLEDNTIQLFSVDAYFNKEFSGSIHYLDKDINLVLPCEPEHLSIKDQNAPQLSEIMIEI